MRLPTHKTKIVCTIGPSSRSARVLEAMMREGMNVARLNFSHGDRDEHARNIETIQAVAARLKRPVALLADLPGPKIRIGKLTREPVVLKKGESLTLVPGALQQGDNAIPVDYKRLPESVAKGSPIYVNDGAILLKVQDVSPAAVRCVVEIGGKVLSRKGINLPGAPIFLEPVSRRELDLIDFGLEHGIHIFGISFVEKAADILKVKEFARKKGKEVYTVAKIERAKAVEHIDEILEVTDAIMVARGDLGVEIPIEDIPVVQKKLIHKANIASRPVITATQMLLSMTENTRPTRAEATDVANAILDGTDGVMLSEESAIGSYPVEAVRMMARIATSSEKHRGDFFWLGGGRSCCPHSEGEGKELWDIVSRNVVEAAEKVHARWILTPTRTGATARRISRFKPGSWVLSFTPARGPHDFLIFSWGVYPFVLAPAREEWYHTVARFLKEMRLVKTGERAVLTQGRFSPRHQATDSLSIVTIP